MGACAAMCMCVDMPTCMCSIVRVCVCATAYMYVYAYARLRNLQERIETGPAQTLANAAGRELDVRAAVGAEDEFVAPAPGTTVSTCPVVRSYRMLPTCCSICAVPSGFRTFPIMACHLYAYMRMRMYGYVRMRG